LKETRKRSVWRCCNRL